MYEEALVGHTRFHATNTDKVGMLVRMISCDGGTREARAKNCTNDGCCNGCVVEGEMVPCYRCRDMRTQLECMREELDQMVNWLGVCRSFWAGTKVGS